MTPRIYKLSTPGDGRSGSFHLEGKCHHAGPIDSERNPLVLHYHYSLDQPPSDKIGSGAVKGIQIDVLKG